MYREKAVQDSEKARLVSEYLQRKNEAAQNKARGKVLWMKPLPLPLEHMQQQQQQQQASKQVKNSPYKEMDVGRNKAEEVQPLEENIPVICYLTVSKLSKLLVKIA